MPDRLSETADYRWLLAHENDPRKRAIAWWLLPGEILHRLILLQLEEHQVQRGLIHNAGIREEVKLPSTITLLRLEYPDRKRSEEVILEDDLRRQPGFGRIEDDLLRPEEPG